ncbi:hypothetical protein [Psychroserpens sp. MEBiC05023]
MAKKDYHISKRIATLLLAFTLLLPSAVKLSHALAHNHEHEVCLEKNQTHFHNIDFDCDFYKFKIQTESTISTTNYDLFSIEDNHKSTFTYYSFLSEYQRLHFSLRGPPINS